MSTRTPYLSTLVLLCAAFPAQAFRVGLAMVADGRPSANRVRRVLAPLWLPAVFLLVAALVWYVAPASGVARLPSHGIWYAVAVAAGLAAPALEVGTGSALALLRGRRVARVRLHERSGGGWLVLAGMVAVAAAEEVIFRGVGLHLLVVDLGWPVAAAVAVTALAYGANHLYFGWLTVLQKSVTGVLFGWLFVAAGHSVLVPVIAHVVQNLLVQGLAVRPGAAR